MGKVAKAVGKIAGAPLKIAGQIIGAPLQAVGGIVGGKVGRIISQTGSLAKNIGKYAAGAIEHTVSGTLNLSVGNVKQAKRDYKKGLGALINTAAIVAAVYGAITTGQTWALPFIVAHTDNLVNQGGLTNATLAAIGSLERALLGSNVINKNLEVIRAAISAVASIATFYVAGGVIGKALAPVLEAYVPAGIAAGAKIASGAYSIYSAVKQIADANERYKQMYEEWLAKFNEWQAYKKQADEAFYNIITSTEAYRYFAGGDVYNSTAPGNYAYAPLTLNEPYSHILSYVKPDRQKYAGINAYVTSRQDESLAGGYGFFSSVEPNMKWAD